ncbi:MAG: ABC transporter ATP-binding protein/permease [Roseiflexus sp.]|nr:ABC transporter ATP-binding protein/permease [Roseiflexus sp.]MCS7289863.1 ABC transporter ATP-binding protein/permease [Roseiflexus sp.]MDW8231797.1 ABC transporter ATP-binding protein [Roseiflexaceae bacterium]
MLEGRRARRARHSFEPEPAATWTERLTQIRRAFGNIPGAFRLVWKADRTSTVIMAALALVAAALPATQAWAGALIVDSVVDSFMARLDPLIGLKRALPYLGFELTLLLIGAAAAQMRAFYEHVLNARLKHTINTEIIRKALTLDLHYFEDASFYDKLQNARREADFRALGIINGSYSVVQNLLTLLSFAVLLMAFSPLIALVLFGATIPAFVAQGRYSNLFFRMLTWRAPEFRRMNYLEYVLTVDSTVKEVKLFNLGEPLLKRYSDIFHTIFREDVDLARRRSIISVGWGALASLSYYGAYAWIVFLTIAGAMTLGGMTFYLTLFRQSQGAFQSLFGSITRLYEHGLFMDNLFTFLSLQPQMRRALRPAPVPPRLRRGLEFRNVSFRYPGRDDWALREINLTIAPGEKLALVGPNGAGKTTLIKLLTRLYDPTEGCILLDGVDLRDYDLDEVRRRISVIFQDFVRYQLTARENIGFGQIDCLNDLQRISEAARRGGADEIVATLPAGIETMLGRWFEHGYELSGGQWQKIALSRAFMRDSEVLVLDEPTAALDAEREYEIFQRFRDLTAGKIAVLISHRFSTVRMADRIAVIEGGRMTEIGTHAELLQRGGTYARLFEMQAKGYR